MSWQLPKRRMALWFWLRASIHIARRAVKNCLDPRVTRFARSNALANAPIIAESRSPLWTDGRSDEFELVAGKVENLRRARHAFDGIVLPAGSMLSFWQQLGRASRLRGFIEGREVRSGCVVPTIGGGICQLTNALAMCAHQANMFFVERHTHTARIQNQVAPETSRMIDATVFWNYIDLRLQTSFDVRIEVELTADELVVRFRAAQSINAVQKTRRTEAKISLKTITVDTPSPPIARGCTTCAETACFRHRGAPFSSPNEQTAVLLNTWTPEFVEYLNQNAARADWYAPWIRKKRRIAGSWNQSNPQSTTSARLASIGKTLLLRKQTGEGGGRQSAVMKGDQWIAAALSSKVKPHHTHLVIDQSLLVHFEKSGVLAGRHYDVLVHTLPANELQARLDRAAAHQPNASSLVDFRANDAYGEIEIRALLRARKLITPHLAVADHLRYIGAQSVHVVPWQVPSAASLARNSALNKLPIVVFPASALARKGSSEIAYAMRELGWQLWVLGAAASDPTPWRDLSVKHVGYQSLAWLSVADVVVLPAYIEHSPRSLLQAFAHGIPIIATAACGLPPSMCAAVVREGDANNLIAALKVVVMHSRENCDKIRRDVVTAISEKEAD
jgi:VanW like protein/Glycosyl transferases group 1